MKVEIGPYRDNEAQEVKIHIDDWDVYSVDYSLSLIIYPILVKLRNINKGHPARLTEQEWNDILDKMIYAFEIKSKCFDSFDACEALCDDLYSEPCTKCMDETEEKMKQGFELFGKYYGDLWW